MKGVPLVRVGDLESGLLGSVPSFGRQGGEMRAVGVRVSVLGHTLRDLALS